MPQERPKFTVPPAGQEWVVLHCRPRCEKKVVDACEREGMIAYLPLRRKKHRYGSRVRVFDVPLFSGYVFCVAPVEQKRWLKQNRLIANVLEVIDQQKLADQLAQIDRALTVGEAVVEVMPYLEKGKWVRVTAGPLRGLEGMVLRVQSKTKVILNVDMIRQSVAVEVDSAFLAPA